LFSRIKSLFDPKVLGIDFGDKLIKLVEIERTTKTIKFKKLALIKNNGMIVHGEIQDFPKLKKKLKDVIAEKGIRAKKVVTAISSEMITKTIIEVPIMPQVDLDKVLPLEYEYYATLPLKQISFQYEILSESNGKYKALIMGVKKSIIYDYLNLFDKLELKPLAIEAEFMALARFIKSLSSAEQQNCCIIDLGSNTTDVSIIHQGKVIFNRTVESGEDDFNSIEQLSTFRKLATKVYRCLDYFEIKYRDYQINKVLLIGAKKEYTGFIEELSNVLGIEIDEISWGSRLEIDLNSEDMRLYQENKDIFTVSIGLALRGEGDG
jgi:type IV pilus assembly protein PilM